MTRPLCAGLAASMLVLLIGALFGVIPAACAAAGMTLPPRVWAMSCEP